jgi:CheY-like chemotaxis protein
MSEKKDPQTLMKEYLEIQTIIIADSSSASRTRLKKCLLDLGAKQNQIKSCSSYEEASEEMEKHNPSIVLSEYMIGKKSGFDLLREFRENHANDKRSLFILITSNGNQSLVAKAAEEEIDSFILKPYTADSIKKTLTKTAIDKLYPSPYIQKIEEGKILLFSGAYKEAKSTFLQAQDLSSKPTLACFYYGQCEAMEEALENAKEKYQEGLSYNKIHYKCLVSLFDILHEQNQFDEAYNIVRRIAQYFPANPQRLGTVLRLAIQTDNTSDIPEYYELFKKIDERPQYLINNMTAGLIICGKYHLSTKKASQGIKLFEQAVIISKAEAKFLLFIIEYLVFYGELNHLSEFMARFSGDQVIKPEYKAASFLVQSAKETPQEIIRKGQQLIRDRIEFPGIYMVLIQQLAQQGRFEEALRYCVTVKEKWPEKLYFFDKIKNRHPELLKDAS